MALVDGHGNFGSIEGDGAAAMRYTEAKLKKFTKDVFLSDLDKNVIDFIPNFDGTETEPEVLPVRVPNISCKWCRRYCCRYGNKYSYTQPFRSN